MRPALQAGRLTCQSPPGRVIDPGPDWGFADATDPACDGHRGLGRRARGVRQQRRRDRWQQRRGLAERQRHHSGLLARGPGGEERAGHARRADRWHRQPGLHAVVRRQQPRQRQGLRERGRVRRGQGNGLHPQPGHVDPRAVQQLLRAGAEEVRLRHQRDLVHPGAGHRGHLLRQLLRRRAGAGRAEGHPDRDQALTVGPQGLRVRRPDRHDQPGASSTPRSSRPPGPGCSRR